MSNNPNYKNILKDIQDATKLNKQSVAALENRHIDDVVVIKLIPNTDDQYYFNGDFILDDTRAVYRSYHLNNSEAILFKAGREYEKRIKDGKLADLQQIMVNLNRQLEAASISSEADAENSQIRIKNLTKEIQHLKDSLTRKDTELSETVNSLNSIRKDYEQVKSDFSNYQQKINSAKIEMFKRGVNVQSDIHGIITPYGKIMED